jgi:hypothetical protein
VPVTTQNGAADATLVVNRMIEANEARVKVCMASPLVT